MRLKLFAIIGVIASTMVAAGAASAAVTTTTYDISASNFSQFGSVAPITDFDGVFTLTYDPTFTNATSTHDIAVDSLSFPAVGATEFANFGMLAPGYFASIGTDVINGISFSVAAPNSYGINLFFNSNGQLFDAVVSYNIGGGTYTSASNPIVIVSAAPEPSTWALMFAGVAMLGAALRYRRQGLAA